MNCTVNFFTKNVDTNLDLLTLWIQSIHITSHIVIPHEPSVHPNCFSFLSYFFFPSSQPANEQSHRMLFLVQRKQIAYQLWCCSRNKVDAYTNNQTCVSWYTSKCNTEGTSLVPSLLVSKNPNGMQFPVCRGKHQWQQRIAALLSCSIPDDAQVSTSLGRRIWGSLASMQLNNRICITETILIIKHATQHRQELEEQKTP